MSDHENDDQNPNGAAFYPRGGNNPNISLQQQAINHDTSAAMTSVLECLTLQQSTYHIPIFDGRNPPLKEFIQDIQNGAVFITGATEPAFVKAVFSKLKGAARESCRDKCFNRVSELIEHLKKRFAPTKKYQWYFESIMTLRLKQSETVGDYYDRLQGLLSGAKYALETKYNKNFREIGQDERNRRLSESDIIMQPVIDCALESFIRGLPEEMSIFVDTRNPVNLPEALEHAIRAEERQKFSEKSRTSSYHITRTEGRPRSPSPYSRQVSKEILVERNRSSSDRDTTPNRSNREKTDDTLRFTPKQLATFYRSMMPQLQAPTSFPPPMQSVAYPSPPTQQVPTFQQPIIYQRQNQGYNSAATPPRSLSPGPQRSPNVQHGNLNFPSTRRLDAAASPTPQRQKNVQFAENTVGSLEQESRPKTPQ